MRQKNNWLILGAAVVALAGLAGCNKPDEETTPPATTTAPGAQTAPGGAGAAGNAPVAGGTIHQAPMRPGAKPK